jgi:hypothetical protein
MSGDCEAKWKVRAAAVYVLVGVAAAIGVWVGVAYRLAHPQLTETQLLLAQWPIITVAVGAVVLAFALRVLR